ncbi:hypothetical protein [Flavobacterium pallidum]|uniref:Uncharacterized protein n=1 Tax=Flavobacterium pallidum TaxID=2172098 RepID=A0A2S1SK27_9FLAO|nr:hypothetical protein [Flavobacterium pallidum]AWI26774.1 hypothetical protein HYN49_13200 [Flavobacterium pallidum]
MRKILLVIFYLTINFAQSQNKFESFVINEKLGIVEISTLSEYIAPTFDSYKKININSDFITIRQNDSLRIFDKKNGNWKKSIYLNSDLLTAYIDQRTYIHIIENNKSVLLDSVFKPAIHFPKAYSQIQYIERSFFYAQNNNTLDIYKLTKKTSVLKHTIDAKFYSTEKKHNDDGSTTDYIMFYGGDATYQFDLDFTLIKKFEKKITEEYELNYLLDPSNKISVSPDGPKTKEKHVEFLEEKTTDKIIYTVIDSSFKIAMNLDFVLKKFGENEFIVYKVFSTVDKDGRKITSMGAKDSYRFKIQFKELKALLPIKYQNEIGLEVLQK